MDKYFIITVDTEGDNLWQPVIRSNGMREITVKNAAYIERFQRVCEEHHFIPTYLVNYEMAQAEPFVGMAKEWAKDGKCEIGMHMHAWNTQPIFELKYKSGRNNPYACEYPRRILWEKLKVLNNLLYEEFDIIPLSHRGGRWYIDAWYVQALKKLGYIVDCSVTSGVSWKACIGYECYGRDYTRYPHKTYYMDGKCLAEEKSSGILEVPPTIMDYPLQEKVRKMIKSPLSYKEIASQKMWLRPNGNNLKEMLQIAAHYEKSSCDYLEFMIHSSELMPGGSPVFTTKESIEKMYTHLEILFERLERSYKGVTLSGYAKTKREA